MGTQSPSLAKRVETLLAGNVAASAGKLQMIGFETIRDRLGARWPRARDQICAFLEREFENVLAPGDVYFRLDELAYIVVLASRSVAELQLVCAKIALDVCRRFFGEEEEVVQVRNLVCEANQELTCEDISIEKTLDAMLEERGKEQLFSRDSAAEEPQASVSPPAPPEPTIAFHASGGSQTHAKLSELQFQFNPVWDVSRRVVLTYLCRAVAPRDACAPPATQFLLTEDPEHQVALDLRILLECSRRLSELHKASQRVLMACPIHWETLARTRFWTRFKSLFHSQPRDVLQDLIVCVHNIDAGTPNIRLTHEFPKLGAGIRGVYASLTFGDRSVERLSNSRVSGVGIVLPDRIEDERAVTSTAREFCVNAEAHNLLPFAFGVDRRSTALALIGIGYRYLEGSAIGFPVGAPSTAFAQGMIDLFDKDLRPARSGS